MSSKTSELSDAPESDSDPYRRCSAAQLVVTDLRRLVHLAGSGLSC
jgi:hypothetical protein